MVHILLYHCWSHPTIQKRNCHGISSRDHRENQVTNFTRRKNLPPRNSWTLGDTELTQSHPSEKDSCDKFAWPLLLCAKTVYALMAARSEACACNHPVTWPLYQLSVGRQGILSLENAEADFTEIKSTGRNKKYLLVLICTYSGLVEALSTRT